MKQQINIQIAIGKPPDAERQDYIRRTRISLMPFFDTVIKQLESKTNDSSKNHGNHGAGFQTRQTR